MKITIYSKESCYFCNQIYQWMNEEKIEYFKKDIDNNSEYLNEFKRLNGQGVPLIVINNEEHTTEKIILGFDKYQIIEAIK